MTAGDARGPSPPSAATSLEQLSGEDWLLLLPYVRAALNALEDGLVTPRMAQLRAIPSGKLASGRSRRDLCRLLAAGGPLWRETVERLARDEDAARRFDWLLKGEEPPPSTAPVSPVQQSPTTSGAGPADRPKRDRETRARGRELVEQRDAARRRATGLEARLEIERERNAALQSRLEQVTADRDELTRRLEDVAAEREHAIERATRHADAQLAAAREELRALRRAEEERRQARRRGASRRVGSGLRAQRDDGLRARRPQRVATAGRPSRLPRGLAPGTADAAAALLVAGRWVLVDGYNVTKQHRNHLPLEHQRLWLVRLLEGLVARTGVRCRVVFDGDPLAGAPATSSRAVGVTFTKGGTADDELVAMVAGVDPDEPVVVVTDDRELATRLGELGVDIIGTREFVAAAE
ncbi:MAG: NYN domain-containing protein [Actinomycetota bacterium]|nr:NYN domain-containing protein [Actinomycetota bacterium]